MFDPTLIVLSGTLHIAQTLTPLDIESYLETLSRVKTLVQQEYAFLVKALIAPVQYAHETLAIGRTLQDPFLDLTDLDFINLLQRQASPIIWPVFALC